MPFSRTEKLERIVELNTQMNQIYDHKDFISFVLKETESIFDVKGTSILLEDEEAQQLSFYVVTGEKKDKISSIKMEYGEGVCGLVFDTGEPFIENDTSKSEFFSDKVDKLSEFHTENVLAVPIKLQHRVLGVFELVNKIEGLFIQEDVDLLEKIAAQIAIVLDNAKHVEEKLKAERLTTIGETVSDLAHCIKNILNGLNGGTRLIDTNIDKVEEKTIKTGWQILKPNIDRISRLSNDMVEFSKNREPNYEALDINQIINDIIELMQYRIDDKQATLVAELEAEPAVIEADPDGIFRAILNLYTNAIDALRRQDGKISFTSTNTVDGKIKISIEDNGHGIKEEDKDKIFVQFFSTKGSEGTGLGLALTKKIVQAHNGSISFISQEGFGTKFEIILPPNQKY